MCVHLIAIGKGEKYGQELLNMYMSSQEYSFNKLVAGYSNPRFPNEPLELPVYCSNDITNEFTGSVLSIILLFFSSLATSLVCPPPKVLEQLWHLRPDCSLLCI